MEQPGAMQGGAPQGGGAPQPAQQGAGDQQQAGQALQQIATQYLAQGRPIELAKQGMDLFCQASGIEAQFQQQGGGQGQPAQGGPPQGDPNAPQGGAPQGGAPAPQGGGPESMAKGGKMKRQFSLPGKGGKAADKGKVPFQRGSIGKK